MYYLLFRKVHWRQSRTLRDWLAHRGRGVDHGLRRRSLGGRGLDHVHRLARLARTGLMMIPGLGQIDHPAPPGHDRLRRADHRGVLRGRGFARLMDDFVNICSQAAEDGDHEQCDENIRDVHAAVHERPGLGDVLGLDVRKS